MKRSRVSRKRKLASWVPTTAFLLQLAFFLVPADADRLHGQTLSQAIAERFGAGGFSIGNYATDGLYPQIKVDKFLEPFRRMQVSSAAMMEQIEKDKTPAKVQAVIKNG